ncbi:MAG: glutathione transferase GstA [Burkholderiaceae bacterium]|jgi:glutathione S-transferase|nr:glutathione transferase GstA [Burkholderiaceae bacterium]
MSLKLYYSPGSCSLSPHIALEESGLPYTLVQANLKTHKLEDGADFYAVNPLGYVPVLQLADGDRLREGAAIVQYIADQAPQKNLAPANGTLARYHMQEWLTFIGTELHKNFGPLFNPATPDDIKSATKDRLLGRLKWIDGELKGKNYLMGEQFTVADAYLFNVTNWTARIGLDIAALANLSALRARVAARPAVQKAMQAEGLL